MTMNHVAKFKTTVAQSTDDGREQDATTWNGNGNASNVITIGNSGGSVYSAAFRFRGVDIPRNAKIVLARLKIRPAVTDSSDPDVKLIVKGIKEANTKVFSQSSRPSQRTKTVNSVAWHIIKKWEVHEWAQTPNLQLLIEEIVAQSGWKPGNALALVIEDNGSSSGQAETCYDKIKGDGYQAELEVWYTMKNVSVGTIAGNDRDGVEINKTTWQGSPTGNVITLGDDGADINEGGLIFSALSIPRHANIIGAYLMITQADQNNRFPNLLIKGFAEDDAAVFASDGSNRPSTRQKTKAQAEWTIGESAAGVFVGLHWTANSVYESPDLREIVQEIVDREGWTPSSRLGVVLENRSSWDGQYKLIWDYVKNTGEFAAKLIVAWDTIRTIYSAQKDILKFDKSNYPEYIIVHHSATPRDSTHFSTIRNNHIGIGWGDVAYHHWIAGALDGLGVHIVGRPENKIGAHADTQKMNYRSIGIALCGTFHPSGGGEQPSAEQLATLQELLDKVRKERGIPKERVLGHRETPDATNCPGDNLLPYIERYRSTGKLLP
ncbi:MAG: peptidoglycan recognition family protein [bacterium]|nr:peptidoglycan recognition family protein [bacterium]